MGGSRGRGRERSVGRASAGALHILRSASKRGAGAEVSGQPAAGESLATSGWPSFERIVVMAPGRGATNLASPDGPTRAGGVWPWSEGGLPAAAADKASQQTSRSNTRNDVVRPPRRSPTIDRGPLIPILYPKRFGGAMRITKRAPDCRTAGRSDGSTPPVRLRPPRHQGRKPGFRSDCGTRDRNESKVRSCSRGRVRLRIAGGRAPVRALIGPGPFYAIPEQRGSRQQDQGHRRRDRQEHRDQ